MGKRETTLRKTKTKQEKGSRAIPPPPSPLKIVQKSLLYFHMTPNKIKWSHKRKIS